MSDFHLSYDWQEGSQVGATADNSELDEGLSRAQFEKWHEEIKAQPQWRAEADRESDYYDGNQLDSEVLRKQQAIGMPPAIEPLIGPVIDSVLGMEAQQRTDWQVEPNSDVADDEIAEAINVKLNKAERQSKADQACSEAFAGQVKVGIHWVEVSRDRNPFNYPYRCTAISRNEMFYDWRGSLHDTNNDHRYLVRRKWTDKEQAKLLFPDHADLIEQASGGWMGFETSLTSDGGSSTGLSMRGGAIPSSYGAVTTPPGGQSGASYPMLAAYQSSERGSSLEEQEWRDVSNNRVCLFEVWYRVWSRALVMKMPDGRIVEYDPDDEMHQMLVITGAIKPAYEVINKVRLSWWLGPHRLSDDPTPYRHNKFPYVQFFGKREDRTGIPYGLIRGMMYMQDNVNAMNAKIRWGISAVRTERTEGAVLDDDATFHNEAARVDADIVLTKNFVKDQHVFKVTRDFQLNEQQYRTLMDSREGIQRCGGIYKAFEGKLDGNQSGVAIANLAQQSNQALADIYDNFQTARMVVGELLLSMILEDMIGKEESVLIKGNGVIEDRQIRMNVPAVDPDTGLRYLNNDVERALLKVTLKEVPSTPSFKAQQLQSFSTVYQSAPESTKLALFPQLLSLMDVPNKQDAIRAVRESIKTPTPEEIDARIKQEVDAALLKAMVEQKNRELDMKETLNEASIKKLVADAVKVGTEAAFAAIQTGQAIATMPQIAPIADVVMKNAGYQTPSPSGDDPNLPIADMNVQSATPPLSVRANTHPQFAPNSTSPLTGVNTLRNDGAIQGV